MGETQRQIDLAKRAGFAGVRTAGGIVPLDGWEPPAPIVGVENGALVGEWRAPSALEEMALEQRGDDPAEYRARDRWELEYIHTSGQ